MLEEYFTKKYFICFGNKRFIKSRERIIKEAKQIDIFDEYIQETEEVCNEEPYKTVVDKMKPGRGFYWYSWKPYIIYKALNKLKDGDILFYCDSGMKIHNNNNVKNKFKKLIDLVSDREKCSGIFIPKETKNKERISI